MINNRLITRENVAYNREDLQHTDKNKSRILIETEKNKEKKEEKIVDNDKLQ